jgi:hypothetical protein
VLSSLGLFAILYGFSAFGSSGTFVTAVITIAVGVVILVFFSMGQLKLEKPFLQIRVLADEQFRTGSIVLMLMSACLTAVSVTLPIYIQTVLGMSATTSGIVMIPAGLMFTNPPVSLWALSNLPNDILHLYRTEVGISPNNIIRWSGR